MSDRGMSAKVEWRHWREKAELDEECIIKLRSNITKKEPHNS